MYPKPEHRSPGDIDCYLMNDKVYRETVSGYQLGNDIARAAGAKVDESWYKHSVISYKGETFENHQYFCIHGMGSVGSSWRRNWRKN